MKLVSIAIFLTVTFFTSCQNRDEKGSTDANNTELTKKETDSTRGDKPAENTTANNIAPDQASINFATKAASGGIMEIEAGKLAQQNAKSQRVKDFGSMMVADHGKANAELMSIASSNNVTIPAAMLSEHKKHVDMMSKMKGEAFDKHYMSMMVNDHNKDIAEFTKQANSANNDAFKAFAAKTLPTLQKHLDSAKAIHGGK